MKLFYWLTVADNARAMFVTFAVIFTAVVVISTIVWLAYSWESDEDSINAAKHARKWVWWSMPFAVLFWSLTIFTPNKRDALLIVAGGGVVNYFTTDSTAKQLPKELTNFVLTEIKSMSQEVKLEMDVRTQRERMLDEAKKLTTEELLEKMSIDPEFANIILNKNN